MGKTGRKIFAFFFVASALIFQSAGCSNVTMDLQEIFTGEERVDRKYTIERMKLGILANIQICPGNQAAGLYAMESVLPHEISRENYIASTVEACSVILSVTPCGQNISDPLIGTNLYTAIIRSCGLRHGEVQI